MGVAAAMTLHRHCAVFAGTVRTIFQPAEEAEPLVGRRIIGEAVLEDVASVLGLQVDHADGHNRRL